MLVKDKMTTNLSVVTPDIRVSEALKMMKDGRFRRLPVVQAGKLVGIVTDKELREATPSKATSLSMHELNYLLDKTTVGDAMHKHPLTVQEDDLLETAALMMRNNKVGALPVMKGKMLVGIITESDIFDTFLDMMGIRGPGRRLQLTLPDVAGSLASVTQIISEYNCNICNIVYSGEGELIVRLEDGDIDSAAAALKKAGYMK